ncbi:MAG: catalase [Clostridia bacterium]|nr:catalase [Clostridia bacterium]
MKFTLKKAFLHTALVLRHKHGVFIGCVKCGLFWRGLVHDLSKFSPTEFIESVRYYQGNRSPIGVSRREQGVSLAWLHHRGRNKHHIEYWYDHECDPLPLMPYKYAVECVCDKLAATKTYAKGSYTPDMPLLHWQRYGHLAPCNPKLSRFIEEVFIDIRDKGEKHVLNKKYMKSTYQRICGSNDAEN